MKTKKNRRSIRCMGIVILSMFILCTACTKEQKEDAKAESLNEITELSEEVTPVMENIETSEGIKPSTVSDEILQEGDFSIEATKTSEEDDVVVKAVKAIEAELGNEIEIVNVMYNDEEGIARVEFVWDGYQDLAYVHLDNNDIGYRSVNVFYGDKPEFESDEAKKTEAYQRIVDYADLYPSVIEANIALGNAQGWIELEIDEEVKASINDKDYSDHNDSKAALVKQAEAYEAQTFSEIYSYVMERKSENDTIQKGKELALSRYIDSSEWEYFDGTDIPIPESCILGLERDETETSLSVYYFKGYDNYEHDIDLLSGTIIYTFALVNAGVK